MRFGGVLGPLLSTKKRRDVLMAVTAAYMLVQLSSLPVAISLPTIAEYFETGINEAAWIVIIYLAMLGSFVLLGARMGDRYGHNRVFFVGIVVSTVGSGFISVSQEFWQVVAWRGVSGVGAALVMGNANAILAANFGSDERGRAFAVPVIGSRFGTLVGLAVFGVLLQYVSWRPVFAVFVPVGLLAIVASLPMLRQKEVVRVAGAAGRVDWLGGALLVAAASVLVLSGSHLHAGEESYVSGDALGYHIPMHALFIAILVGFIAIERRMKNPIVDLKHFRQKPFSMALGSNVTYHFSMLATMTLMPILVQEGFGKPPLYVTIVLFPSQVLGLFMPLVAGWVYDRYRPRMLRPATMMLIAGGFLVLSYSAVQVSFWALPLLMLPISIGTNMFNPVNNATVMNSLAVEHRGVASGMLETTREIGHAFGATAAAGILALSLPAGIDLLTGTSAQVFYRQGFQISSLMVVFVLAFGAILAYLHKSPVLAGAPQATPAPSGSFPPGGDD